MSDEKPFAVSDGVMVEACGFRWANTGVATAHNIALALNACIYIERRKAAAQALREAIESLQSGWKVNEVVGAAAAVERLRAQLAALEGGAT